MIGSVARATLLATALAANGVVPTPPVSPSPSASPSALREIGRIRVTSPLCKTLVAHAVNAVDVVTQNDRRLELAEATLQGIDLDSSEFAKHRGINEITRQYVDLRAAAVFGNGIMRDFREEAKNVTSDEQRNNLATFGDALDGALHRQKTLADAMGRLIAYLDAHPPIDRVTHDEMIFDALLRNNDRRVSRNPFGFHSGDFGPTADVPDPLSVTARNAGVELTRRALPVAEDENTAAAQIEDAFSSC